MSNIKPETLLFLSDLKDNNNRVWFNGNKDRYDKAKENFSEFIQHIINQLASIDPSIGMITPKDCVFRIFRDLRFTPNKSPYKNHMGAYIARGGRKNHWAGYYIHIEPNGSFVSGGIHKPQSKIIRSIRKDMDFYSDTFLQLVNNPDFKKTFSSLGSNSLKKIPAGFSSDSKVAHYLKLKEITPMHALNDNDILSQNLVDSIIHIFCKMQPLVAFINRAIEAAYSEQ